MDTVRWMYLAQNPAADLRLALAYPDKPVTLEISCMARPTVTIDGVKTHLVTSETRRRNPAHGADPAVEQLRLLRELRQIG